MQITVSKQPTLNTIIHLIPQDQDLQLPNFEGKFKEILVLHKEKTEIYVGLGKKDKIDAEKIRNAVATGVARLQKLKKTEASIVGNEVFNSPQNIAEAAILSDYRFDKYKTKKDSSLEKLEIVIDTDQDFASEIDQTQAICSSVNYARDLVNDNACEITPARLAQEAKALAKEFNLKLTILDEKDIKKQGLNLMHAVGKGSSQDQASRFIILEYNGNKNSQEKVALVGKGVTFDTGGLDLKSATGMETMREDMSGAATVLGIMKAAAQTNLQCNLIVAIGAVCNAIGPDAFYPGDIYEAYNKKTVQVQNTDCEGRLVLADVLAYTIDKYKSSCIIDFATLTGAISVALADFLAGIFSNDKNLADQLFEAGEKTGERVWQFPLYEEYCNTLKGDLADINNLSSLGRKGSAITASAFLKEFVDDTPWVHIDIGGVAFNNRGKRGYIPKYGTGFGVRLIMQWLTR